MSKEFSIERDRLENIVNHRRDLIDRVGTGEVKVGSSWENTLKVGRVRARLKTSAARIENKLKYLDEAISYSGELHKRESQLTEMSQMVAEGNLPEEILRVYQREYEDLVSRREINPFLKQIIKDEERQEKPKQVEEEKEVPEFRLPNGRFVKGRVGQVLSVISKASPDSPVTSDELAQVMGVTTSTVRNAIRRARQASNNTGLAVVATPLSFNEKLEGKRGGYYLRSVVEVPEFGNLSRSDVAFIAQAVLAHKRILGPLFKDKDIKLMDEQLLRELSEITGDRPLIDLGITKGEEKSKLINNRRVQALEKIKEIINSPDFEEVCEQIYITNNDVWALLVHLTDMDKVKVRFGNRLNPRQGIDFLVELVANPESREAGFTVVTEPKWLAPESESTPPEESVTREKKPRPKGVERKDPQIRRKLNKYLDDIMRRPELKKPVRSPTVTRVYPRIKRKTINSALESRWIKATELGSEGFPKFDAAAIAAFLYLYDNEDLHLTPRLKNQIQDIAVEEFSKRKRGG